MTPINMSFKVSGRVQQGGFDAYRTNVQPEVEKDRGDWRLTIQNQNLSSRARALWPGLPRLSKYAARPRAGAGDFFRPGAESAAIEI
jgi:hypothetical protein